MYILDRIEGDTAVIEGEEGMLSYPVSMLPEGANDGDVLIISEEGIFVNQEATALRKEAARARLSKLFGN